LPSFDLEAALRGMRGAVRRNASLAALTHVRIGGPAEWFVEPYADEDAALCVRVCRENDLPLHVLGGGSNLLVADEGVRGAVLSLAELNRMVRHGNRIRAGAGVTLASLLRSTKELGLAGVEVLSGIPAQVGGAVAMNAGTREGETFDRLVSLTVVEPHGAIATWDKDRFRAVYRDGRLEGAIVLQAEFELTPDDPQAIFQRFSQSLKKRNATQPVSQKSVGCVFRNPPGDAAGRLIEAAGCKLLKVGGVEVSGLHANYFVNLGHGTCQDFLGLMEEVQKRVRDQVGVLLEPEVRIWGL
jgi:UDP-N-acetylmuramate dehydrogenase